MEQPQHTFQDEDIAFCKICGSLFNRKTEDSDNCFICTTLNNKQSGLAEKLHEESRLRVEQEDFEARRYDWFEPHPRVPGQMALYHLTRIVSTEMESGEVGMMVTIKTNTKNKIISPAIFSGKFLNDVITDLKLKGYNLQITKLEPPKKEQS